MFEQIISYPKKIAISIENIFNGHKKCADTNKYSQALTARTREEFCLFGDFEDLHNRIAGNGSDYQQKMTAIKELLDKKQQVKIIIGVSRYNFLRLNKVAEFCMSVLGQEVDFSSINLNLYPLHNLPKNFLDYVEEVKKNIEAEKIEIIFYDDKITEILKTVSAYAAAEPAKERDLLRLLGIITEQVFIGPQTIVFDPYHRCNSKCQHCWVHTPEVKHPEEFLNRKFDFEIFKKIIDEAAQMMTDGIILQGDGEPLMYDKFMPMLRYARGKGLGVLFFTNGILLDEGKAKEAIASAFQAAYGR